MSARPPAVAAWLLGLAAPGDRREAQLGDLAEEHAERATVDGRAAARWYWRQALASMPPNIAHRMRRAAAALRTERTGEGMMGHLWTDVRHTLRGFRKDLAFHAVVILTLGLGIGAIATTFSAVYGLVLNPFPFPEASRIVGVGTAYPALGSTLGFFENLSPAEFQDIRDNAETLDDIVAWDMGNRQIDTEGPAENVFTAFWWGDALTTLGMPPHLGRGFTADEIATGAPVAMLGYDAWVARFGADSSMVGDALSINGTPYTLIGIFPTGVDIYGTQLWTVMPVGPEVYDRGRRQFQVMGRIREGSSLTEVNTELTGIASRVEQAHVAEFEEYRGWSIQAMRWSDVNSQSYRAGAWVLLGSVGFVLLLVCANTANLLLARAQSRRREMSVRAALGARRGRLVSLVLTQSVMLASVGGLLGVGLAVLGVGWLRDFLNTVGARVAGDIVLNGPVLAFSALVAVGSGIVFGLAPALQSSTAGLAEALKTEGKSATAGASHQRLQRTFVGVQVALAFLLLTGGGLLVNSLVRVTRVDPGFDADRVLTMRLTIPLERYEPQAVPVFFRDLTERLEALPEVQAAAAGSQYPGVAFAFREVFLDGAEADADATLPVMLTTAVTRGYFEALGIPIRRGRTFAGADQSDSPRVAIVNEEAARRYFGDVDPVGQRLKIGGADPETPWWEIVGVVGSTKNLGLDQDPFPEVFALHEQVGGYQNQLFLTVRAGGDPASLIAPVRSVVSDMDPDQAVYAIRTAEETFAQGVAPMRATALMLTLFAGFALVLAAVGVYAVVSYTVTERTQEIGLRVALGADQGRVRRLVVRQALLPVLIGAVFGLGGAVAVGTGLQRILFDVTGTDPLTLGAVAVLLVGAAAVASWVPAFRAARLDPVEALRAD